MLLGLGAAAGPEWSEVRGSAQYGTELGGRQSPEDGSTVVRIGSCTESKVSLVSYFKS